MLNVRVGERGERSVGAERASQQAERFSHTRKSRKSGRRGKCPDNDDEVINAESTRSLRGKERYCPLLRGQVLMSQLRKNTVKFPMVRKILQVPNTQTALKSLKAQHELGTIPDCVAEDHEINIVTIAEELKANNEGFPICGHGEGAGHL